MSNFPLWDALAPIFKSAMRHGVHAEFMEFLLRDLKVTEEQVRKAANYAAREWDL